MWPAPNAGRHVWAASRGLMDQMTYTLYGLTEDEIALVERSVG